jgi:hypothetical protein
MRHVSVVILTYWSLLMIGCGSTTGENDDSDVARSAGETVVIAVDHRTQWRELRIEGVTDLPDGAVVSYRVTHALTAQLPPSEWPAKNLIADGTAAVETGHYWARFNTTYWPAGAVRVQVRFPVAPQPDAIRARYGEFGEQLVGSNVTTLGGSKVVTAEHALDWTR